LSGFYPIRISLCIDLNAKLWCRPLRGFIGWGDLILVFTFLSREEKSNQKKTPVFRSALRVAKPGEAARIMLSGKASSEARRAAIVRL
jgi:hypothetical protein